MTPSRDLYDLIHSLTAAEKRYVRRTALVSGRDAAWLRLFDAIERQKDFDEEELRGMLRGDRMLGNLSVAKRYVYNAVLRALQSYGAGRDFDSELGEMIEQYKVLVHKGLHAQAARMMRDIKQQALAGDAYLRYFWAIIREFGVGAHSTEHAAMDYLEGFLQEQQWTLRRMENYSLIAGIYFRQRIILRHRSNPRSSADQQRLREIIEPLLEMQEDQLLSPTANSFFHLALGDYWEAIGRPEQARLHIDRFLDPARLDGIIDATDSLRLAEFTNALSFRLRHRMTEGLEQYVDALHRKVGKLDRRGQAFTTQMWFYERWLVASLMLLNLRGRIDEAAKLLRDEQESIERLQSAMSKKWRLQLSHMIAAIRLAQGEYAAAIDTLNSVLNDTESSTDEYGAAMLLSLVAHIEAGNVEWLDAAFRSATRHLTSHGRYHQTEKAMIAGLRRVVRARDDGERREAFLHLHEQLQELFKDSRERTALVSLDLLAWTRAHATGVPFAELIGERADNSVNEQGRNNIPAL